MPEREKKHYQLNRIIKKEAIEEFKKSISHLDGYTLRLGDDHCLFYIETETLVFAFPLLRRLMDFCQKNSLNFYCSTNLQQLVIE